MYVWDTRLFDLSYSGPHTVKPTSLCDILRTICPRSSDPYYILSYYIRWVNTSWTYSNPNKLRRLHHIILIWATYITRKLNQGNGYTLFCTFFPL